MAVSNDGEPLQDAISCALPVGCELLLINPGAIELGPTLTLGPAKNPAEHPPASQATESVSPDQPPPGRFSDA
jgi:hypothetical protein